MGRQTCAVCPKCRKKIDIIDYKIDVDFAGTIATAGSVRLEAGIAMRSGEIRAAIVELASRVEGGRITAWHRLEIRAGGVCHPDQIEFRDLQIHAGAVLAFETPATCRQLEVSGELEGAFSVTGPVILRRGGVLRGSLACDHLTVEDGASLEADLRIRAGAQDRES